MAIKNLQKIFATTFDGKPFEVSNRKAFLCKKHAPRSVCDSERDRRRGKDPLSDEEMQ
jgi:hypothetical protein